jgi:uncharacterized protein (TIGR02246 family)
MFIVRVLCLSLFFLTSSAFAGPKEDAFQVVERWAKAFTEADVETIASLYAPDAVFIGTDSKAISAQPEDIKKYFQGVLLGSRRFVATLVESNITTASDAAFVVTALDKLAITADGKTQDALGRVTFVVAKRESGWKIVAFHRSRMPS